MLKRSATILMPLLATSLLLHSLTTTPVTAGVYRDKNGKIRLSDTPPIEGGYTAVETKGRYTSASASTQGSGRWEWVPVTLPTASPDDTSSRPSKEIFEVVSKSVWKVLAATSEGLLNSGQDVAQGSAVAVSAEKLLTNCHVVEGRSHIIVQQKGKTPVRATVAAGDVASDRCILTVEGVTLQPVSGYRPFDSLTVGEAVYTVGAPRNLDNTLGHGLISGLRTAQGHHFVQTTAQISPGSSGGGLFDNTGNLIGITTFQVRQSDGLNFAIAAEDFTK